MSKEDSLSNQFDQLKIFMTGSEWKKVVNASSDAPVERMGEMWEQKEAEAKTRTGSGVHGAGVYKSLKEKGYVGGLADAPRITFQEGPGGTTRREQGEGHHRVAAAAALEEEGHGPVYIPTNYADITPGVTGSQMRKIARADAIRKMKEAGIDVSNYE